jgi:hypothetical protein
MPSELSEICLWCCTNYSQALANINAQLAKEISSYLDAAGQTLTTVTNPNIATLLNSALGASTKQLEDLPMAMGFARDTSALPLCACRCYGVT